MRERRIRILALVFALLIGVVVDELGLVRGSGAERAAAAAMDGAVRLPPALPPAHTASTAVPPALPATGAVSGGAAVRARLVSVVAAIPSASALRTVVAIPSASALRRLHRLRAATQAHGCNRA
ncbi:MAG TPA: hypothetical protein VFQ38_15470 [Longimicrobiales bacterium]|nr:hypothetical protein [Longimicrobiales bacterium]